MGLQGTVIRSIFQTAASFGAAFDTLCEMSGIHPEEIGDSENMVEWEKARPQYFSTPGRGSSLPARADDYPRD